MISLLFRALTPPLAVPPNFYTSKQWLKVNGLKATELTIYQVRQSIHRQ